MSALTQYPDATEAEPQIHGSSHLEDILQSECFKRATTLRSLLLYLWQNRDKEISEYAIAVEALGRNPNFESKADSTVRVHIGRLRQFLAKYYESEGRHATARLVIPLGTHQLQWIEAEPKPRPANDPQNNPGHHPRASAPVLVPVLGTTIVLLIACIGFLLWQSAHQANKPSLSSRRELPLFWKKFMDNGKPARILLPTPMFFGWGLPDHDHNILVRDTSINNFDKSTDSAPIVDLEKHWGKPQPWQNYTVASDTIASLQLARFLDAYGVQTSFSRSNQAPDEIIDHENLVAFGTASFLAAADQVDLDRLSFKMGPHEAFVIDKHQPAATANQFPTVQESASRTVTPGIIALLPRDATGSRVLLIQGTQTTALIAFLTSDEGMREITEAQSQQPNSKFFEAVVLSEVNVGNPIQSRLVAFRPFIPPTGIR